MNDPPRKYWSTLVYCQLRSPYSSLDPAHLFFLRATFSCTGYVPKLFLGDRAFGVSKSCFAQAGAGTALFITMSSALSCCPLKSQSIPVGTKPGMRLTFSHMFIHAPLGNRRRATPEIAVVDLPPRSAGWRRSPRWHEQRRIDSVKVLSAAVNCNY